MVPHLTPEIIEPGADPAYRLLASQNRALARRVADLECRARIADETIFGLRRGLCACPACNGAALPAGAAPVAQPRPIAAPAIVWQRSNLGRLMHAFVGDYALCGQHAHPATPASADAGHCQMCTRLVVRDSRFHPMVAEAPHG